MDPTSFGHALSLHKHRDRPLMSLHLCLRPTCVGVESKNERPEPDDSGSACSLIGMEFVSACPMHVVSKLMGDSWGDGDKAEPDSLEVVTRTESTLAIGATKGATRTQRSAKKHILALSVTHHHIPSLLLTCHLVRHLTPSRIPSQTPSLPRSCHGCCKSH